MDYELILDDSSRIVGWYFPPRKNAGLVVKQLPEGEWYDYLYADGEYVYEPLPRPEPAPSVEEQLRAELEDADAALSELGVTV